MSSLAPAQFSGGGTDIRRERATNKAETRAPGDHACCLPPLDDRGREGGEVKKFCLRCAPIPLLACLVCVPVFAQGTITSPKEQFGFNIGDDYQLVNYARLIDYWRRLAVESDRITLEEIGTTAEGRTMVMAVITSPENRTRLTRYREIAAKLALAAAVGETEARELAHEGRAIVWIDGGLHATEVLGAQQLIETVYQMVSQSDPETLRVLRDVILLVACSNPDGMDLVSDWYMREPQPEKRSTANVPRLYHKYIGHDNNRDFYMSTQPETEAINRVFYHEWFPQIVYNHHQTGPAGTVLFAPPFRDPFNYHFDPLVPVGIDLVAAAMHNRFAAEGKPGATMRSGAGYSTWFNGGLRTTVYFHNMIGLLTEAIGNPTPIEIPFVPRNQLPRGDLPMPVPPQKWHFRQSVEYSLTANRAVLDVASKYREELLFNIYRMGMNSIERGSRDSWTVVPHMIRAIQERVAADLGGAAGGEAAGEGRQTGPGSGETPLKYYEMLRDPKSRDPRAYIIPSDQPDFLTATKFVNTLIKTGVGIHRATVPFSVGGKSYPAGSYVVKTAQAFRPHILDMFEPQDHPDDLLHPGGPPRPTYDSAGWTLAYQMGVQFDRILEGFDGPFEEVSGCAGVPAGRVAGMPGAGFMLSRQPNDSFRAVNRLLAAGREVYWLTSSWSSGGKSFPAGTLFMPSGKGVPGQVRDLAEATGLEFTTVAHRPTVEARKLHPVRIGLWDRFGGSIPSGWTRWVLEQFEFPLDLVYARTLDAGNLAAEYDVLIFPSGAIPRAGGSQDGEPPAGRPSQQIDPSTIPEEYRGRLGDITIEKTIPQLRQFLDDGGTLIAVGSSTRLAYHLGLPVADALLERCPDGTERRIERSRLYVPGSLLQARVDKSNPVAHGMGDWADVYFDNSPVFRLLPEAGIAGVRPVAWFSGKRLLRSGWAIGEGYLDQGVVVVDAPVGKGRVYLFGPEITFRGQPHGTFKFLFNAILYARSEAARLQP
jgi:hypothetical protein